MTHARKHWLKSMEPPNYDGTSTEDETTTMKPCQGKCSAQGRRPEALLWPVKGLGFQAAALHTSVDPEHYNHPEVCIRRL